MVTTAIDHGRDRGRQCAPAVGIHRYVHGRLIITRSRASNNHQGIWFDCVFAPRLYERVEESNTRRFGLDSRSSGKPRWMDYEHSLENAVNTYRAKGGDGFRYNKKGMQSTNRLEGRVEAGCMR